MKYAWTMKAKGRYVDSGSVEATSESEALNLVMIDQAEQDRDADTCYSLTCGSTATTSFGDEFLRSAGASSIDDTQLDSSGYNFAPSLADVGIDPHQDTADQLVKDIAEAIVKKVVTDAVTDMGFDVDPDRAREAAAIANAGCGKTFEECIHVFDNAENFGGLGSSPCPHVFDDPACGATSGRMSANQPNLSQAPSRSPDTIIGRAMTGGAKGDTIDVIFDDGRRGSGQLGEKCVVNEGLRHGYDGRFYPPRYGDTENGPEVFAKGGLVSNDVEYIVDSDGRKPAPFLGGALGEVKRAWVNSREIDPQDAGQIFGQGPTTEARVPISTWGLPSTITCDSPHCQEVIPIGHLPMGTTSGVPCPGCNATYSVMRN
tara:strand:- start:810 stop:1928 length:1119 start_codon:yes stop_codon:yes gene_type:complete